MKKLIKKDSAHILITLPTKLLKLLDKRRKAYYDLTRSEYIKNLILNEKK